MKRERSHNLTVSPSKRPRSNNYKAAEDGIIDNNKNFSDGIERLSIEYLFSDNRLDTLLIKTSLEAAARNNEYIMFKSQLEMYKAYIDFSEDNSIIEEQNSTTKIEYNHALKEFLSTYGLLSLYKLSQANDKIEILNAEALRTDLGNLLLREIEKEYPDVVLIGRLLRNGVHLNNSSEGCYSFCMEAFINQDENLIRYIIENNLDLAELDCQENSYLMMAAISGRVDITRLLIQHGVDINKKNSHGESAPHLAILTYQDEIIRMLLNEPSLDINIQDAEGNTLLHRYILENNRRDIAVIRLILEHPDYNKDIKNNNGLTVNQLALIQERENIPADNWRRLISSQYTLSSALLR